MKFKLLLAAALVIAMMAIMPGPFVLAQNVTDSHLTINMTGMANSYLVIGQGGVSNSSLVINTSLVEVELTGLRVYPISVDFGLIRPGDVKYTGQEFQILNATNTSLNVTIAVTGDWSGVTNWTHSDDCIPGADLAAMVAVIEDGNGHVAVIVRKTEPYNYIATNLPVGAALTFGLQLYAPTSFSDYHSKGNTIFIEAEGI